MSATDEGVIPEESNCPICSKPLSLCEHSDEERIAVWSAMASGRERPMLTADAGEVEKAARTARQKEKQRKKDFEWVMNDPRGRRIVWAMLERAGIYRVGFLEARGEHAGMAFLDGQKNIGIELMHRCIAETPAHYALMVKENGG